MIHMEILICFIIWTSAAIFSLFKVYQFGRDVDPFGIFVGDFSNGWRLIERPKDVSDYEWNSWKLFAIRLLPWICVHIVFSEVLRNIRVYYLKLWYCALPFIFIIHYFGILPLLLMLIQPLMYWIVLCMNKRASYIWLWSCIFLMAVNIIKYFYELDNRIFSLILKINEDDFYMMLICISWIQLRCISYCLEKLKVSETLSDLDPVDGEIKKHGLLELTSYSFYLPLLFLGPVILYSDFQKSFIPSMQKQFKRRILNLIKNLSRYLGWFLFIEVSLHFIYFNALQYHTEIVKIMPDWCLYGGGLWMGLYFYLKYLITYGITGSMAAVDNIAPETPPLCIARVHLYSQMWKYFDVGLHKFLIRYIYKPVVNAADDMWQKSFIIRSFASLSCFIFVLLWHGMHYFIFVWTTLNYIGILIENMAIIIFKNHYYQTFLTRFFSKKEKVDRFHAFLSAPVLALSALSNFYFFAGSEVGYIYVRRVLDQSLINGIGMYVCLYSCCRVSQFLINVHARKIKM